MLSVLREHPDFECALASGAWRESVLLKTRSAGLVIEGLPLATSDDSSQREEIVQMSIERAQSQYHLPADTLVTLVGDGPWDFQVATNLKHHFVGIGSGRQRLLECGARVSWSWLLSLEQALRDLPHSGAGSQEHMRGHLNLSRFYLMHVGEEER